MPSPNQKQPIAKTPEYDHCKKCGQIFPSEYFLDPGRRICKICDEGPPAPKTEVDRAALKKKVATLTARQVMATLTRTQIDVPHTSELAAAIMKRMGGVEKFAERYMGVVEAILEKDQSTRLALSAVDGIAKMIRDSTVMRETAPDAQNLSDEDLEAELQRLIDMKLQSGDIVLELEQDGEAGG